MKTATIRDVRNNFSKLENWLREGEEIEIRRRREVVAILSRPSSGRKEGGAVLPDFRKRREVIGLRPLNDEDLQSIRTFEDEGQEG